MRAISSGAEDYIIKPFQEKTLLSKVDKWKRITQKKDCPSDNVGAVFQTAFIKYSSFGSQALPNKCLPIMYGKPEQVWFIGLSDSLNS